VKAPAVAVCCDGWSSLRQCPIHVASCPLFVTLTNVDDAVPLPEALPPEHPVFEMWKITAHGDWSLSCWQERRRLAS
jgi:hypothetical protein